MSNKSVSRDRTNLLVKEAIVKSESKTAEILNMFFSSIVGIFNVSVYNYFDPIIENMKVLFFKTILKYKNHRSILQIRTTRKNGTFYFKEVTVEEREKNIGDIPTRNIKENADILTDSLCKGINAMFKWLIFPNSLKLSDFTPLHKKINHISDISKKVGGNLTALARIALFIGSSKRRILMNVFLILDLIIVPLFGCIT